MHLIQQARCNTTWAELQKEGRNCKEYIGHIFCCNMEKVLQHSEQDCQILLPRSPAPERNAVPTHPGLSSSHPAPTTSFDLFCIFWSICTRHFKEHCTYCCHIYTYCYCTPKIFTSDTLWNRYTYHYYCTLPNRLQSTAHVLCTYCPRYLLFCSV